MTQNPRNGKSTVRLSDRLTADSGRYFLPGIQALVRFPLEQARLDRAAGLWIATFISGYPGSRLAGYAALRAAIDKLGRCVLIDHSQKLGKTAPAGIS